MAQISEDNANSGIQRLKRVAIIGCGSFGAQIAVELCKSGNLVIMIEPLPEEDRPAMNKVIDELVAKLP